MEEEEKEENQNHYGVPKREMLHGFKVTFGTPNCWYTTHWWILSSARTSVKCSIFFPPKNLYHYQNMNHWFAIWGRWMIDGNEKILLLPRMAPASLSSLCSYSWKKGSTSKKKETEAERYRSNERIAMSHLWGSFKNCRPLDSSCSPLKGRVACRPFDLGPTPVI